MRIETSIKHTGNRRTDGPFVGRAQVRRQSRRHTSRRRLPVHLLLAGEPVEDAYLTRLTRVVVAGLNSA
jgi:hypothetical protein